MPSVLTGLLGGTFDPIHNGHLHVAQTLLQQLPLTSIQFIPCNRPTHRPQPIASAEQRLTMIKWAIKNNPAFSTNNLELQREGPSYTIDTVKTLKAQNPEHIFCWIIGADAFNHFESWQDYKNILNYCHLIIVNRPDHPVKDILKTHQTTDPNRLLAASAGKILIQTLPPSTISATTIRQQLAKGCLDENALPKAVVKTIQAERLYQR